MSFDEKGKIAVKQYAGSLWTTAKHFFTPYAQKVKGILDFFMVRNVHSGEKHYKFYDWKNTFIVNDFLEELLHVVYPNKILHVILDNWSCHKSGALHAFAAFEPRLQLHYLPTCSSWMNPVERDFALIQQDVLDTSNFQHPLETIQRIAGYIEKEL